MEGAPYKPGDVVAGRYAIQEVVGSGPMGFVFRAQDQEIDVEVALKAVHPRLVQQPEERTQFSLSLRVGKKLNHPNLLRVYEEGLDADRPFFTMQLLEGMTLRRMMEQRASRGQLFSLKDVDPLLSQMAAALDAAHRFGPHSDLKPENVIVLPDLLKVTDYGLGLAVPHLPFVQAQKGHRADVYIAPEYVNGGELDTRLDVYSLGVILGEMLTGLLPVDGVTPELTVHHPDLPPALDSLYRRALNPNPLARPKTAGELYAEFAGILARTPAAVANNARSVPSAATAAAAAAVRAATRPPPPVPTDMLPAVQPPVPAVPAPKAPEPRAPEPRSLEVKAPEPRAPEPRHAEPRAPEPRAPEPEHEEEAPPPDATQPLDAETLAAIMGGPHPSRLLTEQALPFIAPPSASKAPPAASRPPPAAPEPTPRAAAPQSAPRPSGPAPRPSGPVQALPPRASAPRLEAMPSARADAKTLEASPSVATSRHEAKTLEPSPAVPVSRSEAKTLEPSPAVSGARSGLRTLESSPAVSGARSGVRRMDSPTMSGARSGAIRVDAGAMSGARSGAIRVDSPTMSGARSGMRTGALPTLPVARAAKAKSHSTLWLVLLSVAGLVVGAGGGFLVVRHLRQQQVTPGQPGANAAGGLATGSERCREGMRLVPGGAFLMGTSKDDPQFLVDGRQLMNVDVPAYCIDTYEYPNRAGEAPKVQVTLEEARGLCEGAGKRLCKEEEWEKACKGPNNSRFSYGGTESVDACNTRTASNAARALAPSGQFTGCGTASGVMDLGGNVAEWTDTSFDRDGYTLKGGSFDKAVAASRCSAREGAPPTQRSGSVGFRCCADPVR